MAWDSVWLTATNRPVPLPFPHPPFIGSLLLPGLNLLVRAREGIVMRVARGPRSCPFPSPLSAVTHFPHPPRQIPVRALPSLTALLRSAERKAPSFPPHLTYTRGSSVSSLEKKNSYVETGFLCLVQGQSLRTWLVPGSRWVLNRYLLNERAATWWPQRRRKTQPL